MEKIRQDTSPNALRSIEICESRDNCKVLEIAIHHNSSTTQ